MPETRGDIVFMQGARRVTLASHFQRSVYGLHFISFNFRFLKIPLQRKEDKNIKILPNVQKIQIQKSLRFTDAILASVRFRYRSSNKTAPDPDFRSRDQPSIT